ncbi:integrase [Paucibacter sp. AS339]|uniref:integrase n=1 Tax=Paucibacter hankyongi TaxID=3133434 RepID=UPI00309DABFB
MSVPKPTVYTLPILRRSKVSAKPGPGFIPVDHHVQGRHVKYWRELAPGEKERKWSAFPQFPLVLSGDGSPWGPACLWLLDRARARPLHLSSLPSVAQGLRDYLGFLEDMGLAWDDFSSVDKYLRPTYLYKTHLQELINKGETKASTASRKMSAVIGMYRFLMSERKMGFQPMNPPWIDKEIGLHYRDNKGFGQVHTVASTDISIHVPTRDDPWDATIDDGGKLRPLPSEEQRALVAALKKLGNRDFELMHYVALFTGAREQTVLTLRWGHFKAPPSSITQWPFKLPCGPGTGIDTKRDVPNVFLVIPEFLYWWLHQYACSERARSRRDKSQLGQHPVNYLFLSNQGGPYYESKDDRNAMRGADEVLRRSSPTGQNLRSFITDRVIPEVRKTIPGFKYRFHDLRATFGVNWVLHCVGKEDAKQKYMLAREQLRRLMWHKHPTTTDRYLEYHEHMHHLEKAKADWDRVLLALVQSAT